MERALVSHVSHRGVERGCAKRTVYVKRRVKGAWIEGMEGPRDAQGAKVLGRFGGVVQGLRRGFWKGIPVDGGR